MDIHQDTGSYQGFPHRHASHGKVNVLCSVKQGCKQAPTLVTLFLAAVIEEMSDDTLDGIYIRTRLDGGLFNLSQLKRHVLVKYIRDLLYANDW